MYTYKYFLYILSSHSLNECDSRYRKVSGDSMMSYRGACKVQNISKLFEVFDVKTVIT